tara:strand:+ start:292 stop:732 length:441 start_codon:yes stop_codon:yes gene_type:complete
MSDINEDRQDVATRFQKGSIPWNKGNKSPKMPQSKSRRGKIEPAPDMSPPPAAEKVKDAQELIQVYRAHYGPQAFREIVQMAFWPEVPFRERCTLLLFIAQQWAGKPPSEATAPITFNFNLSRAEDFEDRSEKTITAGHLKIGQRV